MKIVSWNKWNDLPFPFHHFIISFLDFQSLLNTRIVSKKFLILVAEVTQWMVSNNYEHHFLSNYNWKVLAIPFGFSLSTHFSLIKPIELSKLQEALSSNNSSNNSFVKKIKIIKPNVVVKKYMTIECYQKYLKC